MGIEINAQEKRNIIKWGVRISEVRISEDVHCTSCHDMYHWFNYCRKEYLLEMNTPDNPSTSTDTWPLTLSATPPSMTAAPPPSIQPGTYGETTASHQTANMPHHPISERDRLQESHDVPSKSHNSVSNKSPDHLGESMSSKDLFNKLGNLLDGTQTWLDSKKQKLKTRTATVVSAEVRPGPSSLEVRPYVRKRVWDADLQRFVVNRKT